MTSDIPDRAEGERPAESNEAAPTPKRRVSKRLSKRKTKKTAPDGVGGEAAGADAGVGDGLPEVPAESAGDSAVAEPKPKRRRAPSKAAAAKAALTEADGGGDGVDNPEREALVETAEAQAALVEGDERAMDTLSDDRADGGADEPVKKRRRSRGGARGRRVEGGAEDGEGGATGNAEARRDNEQDTQQDAEPDAGADSDRDDSEDAEQDANQDDGGVKKKRSRRRRRKSKSAGDGTDDSGDSGRGGDEDDDGASGDRSRGGGRAQRDRSDDRAGGGFDEDSDDGSDGDDGAEEGDGDGGRRGKSRSKSQKARRTLRPRYEDEIKLNPSEMPPAEMYINYAPGDECRIAVCENGLLQEYTAENLQQQSRVGNIYVGKVRNVEQGIQAAFVDFGVGENGFLHISDLHPMYWDGEPERVGVKTPRRERPPIEKALKRGQDVIVQVIKEGIGTKGPTVTSYISVPGRYLVMMPFMGKVGVSRKVDDEDERRRMREVLDSLDLPEGFGFILRTAGMDRTKTELKRDLAYLQRLWKDMEKRRKGSNKPRLLYSESDLLLRTLRDHVGSNITKVIIDSEVALQRAATFMKIVAPRSAAKLAHYQGSAPLFHAFGVEHQVSLMYAREVPLPSGGRLVIDQTEALVAIDVNSGKFRAAADAEDNAYRINMEAADEICRQLRLRDLGGLVINDLIDMRAAKHRKAIENRFKELLKRDRAKATVAGISQFGILEMTRQRMRGSHETQHFFECPTCRGRGLVQRPESVSGDALRSLAVLLDSERVGKVEMVVSPRVAGSLLSTGRGRLGRVERQFGKAVEVRISDTVPLDQVRFYAYDPLGADVDTGRLPRIKQPVVVDYEDIDPSGVEDIEGYAVDVTAEAADAAHRQRAAELQADREEEEAELERDAEELLSEDELETVEGAGGKKRKRRRRKRGGRGSRGEGGDGDGGEGGGGSPASGGRDDASGRGGEQDRERDRQQDGDRAEGRGGDQDGEGGEGGGKKRRRRRRRRKSGEGGEQQGGEGSGEGDGGERGDQRGSADGEGDRADNRGGDQDGEGGEGGGRRKRRSRRRKPGGGSDGASDGRSDGPSDGGEAATRSTRDSQGAEGVGSGGGSAESDEASKAKKPRRRGVYSAARRRLTPSELGKVGDE